MPARTPPETIARLHREIATALNSGEVKDQLAVQGLDALPTTPQQFAVFVTEEIAKWAKVIKLSGAKGD